MKGNRRKDLCVSKIIKSNCTTIPVCLGSFTSQSSSQLDILLLDGNTLSVDSGQVGVFEQRDQVSFNGFL